MSFKELGRTVAGILQEGKIEEALSTLIEGAEHGGKRHLREDAVRLKAGYAQARYQFEVKALMSRAEFELIQNKTINGIQAILNKLEAADTPPPPARKTLIIAGIIVLAAVILGWWWIVGRQEDPPPTFDKPAMEEAQQTPAPSSVSKDPASDFQKEAATGERKRPETPVSPKPSRPAANATNDKLPAERPARVETCTFQLILNVNMIDARVLIDGAPAQIVSGAGTQVKTIKTTPGSHKITLRNNKLECSFDTRISPGSQVMQPSTCN